MGSQPVINPQIKCVSDLKSLGQQTDNPKTAEVITAEGVKEGAVGAATVTGTIEPRPPA
jgi:hypothetical protein